MESFSLRNLAVWRHRAGQPSPLGRVLLVHGIGEHSGRHLNTVAALTGAGFEVVRFDLRGAGKSGGRRQWVERFEDYVSDVNEVFNWCLNERPKIPMFVLGHSLGGLISIYFASLRSEELTGLILSAPAYQVGQGVSALRILAAKVLAKLTPTLAIPATLGKEWISRDPEVVEAYRQDPLACHFNTVQQGRQILYALDAVSDRVAEIQCPLMIAHGTADRIILPVGSFLLFQRSKSADKELYFLPGGFHEPHNDYGKETYFQYVAAWLRSHCG